MIPESLFFLYYNGEGSAEFFLTFLYNEFLPERYRTGRDINTKPQEEEMEFLLEIAKTNFLVD